MSGSLTFATGDSLTVSLGAATVTAAYTQILVTKWTDPVSGTVNALKAGSDNCNLITDSGGTDLGLWNGTNVRDSTVSIPFAGWAALAVTKAAGTATGRAHKYDWATGAWTHGAMSGTSANVTVTTSWIIGTGIFAGNVAAFSVGKSALADATFDALTNVTWQGIRALALEENWRLDGSGSFNGTGTSTQSAISGTSHSTDEPPGFWGTPDVIMPDRVS